MSDFRLRVHEEGKEPGELALPDGAEIVAGRLPGVDIEVADTSVSRRHLVIRRRGESIAVEDLGSANGTYVAGRSIAAPVELSRDDDVRLGDVRIEIVWPEASAPAADGAEFGAVSRESEADEEGTVAMAREEGVEEDSTVAVPRPESPSSPDDEGTVAVEREYDDPGREPVDEGTDAVEQDPDDEGTVAVEREPDRAASQAAVREGEPTVAVSGEPAGLGDETLAAEPPAKRDPATRAGGEADSAGPIAERDFEFSTPDELDEEPPPRSRPTQSAARRGSGPSAGELIGVAAVAFVATVVVGLAIRWWWAAG